MEDIKNIGCIFSSDDKLDYITVIHHNRIWVYGGYNLILEFNSTDACITGAAYINNTLYFTKNGCNAIYFYNNRQQSRKLISEYDDVKLVKYINNTNQWFVLEINNKKLIVYDLTNEKELFDLPIQNNFVDFSITDQGCGVMIGSDETDVSVYEGDGDKRYTILCSFQYLPIEGKIHIVDRLYLYAIYDGWDVEYRYSMGADKDMKLPSYTGEEVKEKSISAFGNYIIYYSDESKRIVISKYQNGIIYRIFVLPKEFTEKAKFYFNEDTNIFTVFDNDCIEQYIIEQSNQEIERLNNLCNNRGNENLENTIYQIIFSCKCINIGEKMGKYKYDIALSFAGEDRTYVDVIANKLKNKGIKVFYDKFETSNLWGKDLYQYLSHVYKDNARYCVIFVSNFYKNKVWTRHELRNAQNRAFVENKEYILPIFLEDIELDGLNDTIGYIKTSEFSENEIVDLIIEKIQ